MISFDNDYIDPEKSEALLRIDLTSSKLVKSFYSFDFSSLEGVAGFLELLTLVDAEVIKQASAELWPGSVTESFDPQRARFELRGYLLDLINSGELIDEGTEEQAASESAAVMVEEPDEEAAPVEEDDQQQEEDTNE